MNKIRIIFLSFMCALGVMTSNVCASTAGVDAAYEALCANQESILGYTCQGRIERYKKDGFFHDGECDGLTKMTKMGQRIRIVNLATDNPPIKLQNENGFVALLQSYHDLNDLYVEYVIVGDADGQFKQFDISYTNEDLRALVTSSDNMSQGHHKSLVEQYIAGIDVFVSGKGQGHRYTIRTLQR